MFHGISECEFVVERSL